MNDLRLQVENIKRSADETSRERDHSKQQLETTNYEKSSLEKTRMVISEKNIKYIYFFNTFNNFD